MHATRGVTIVAAIGLVAGVAAGQSPAPEDAAAPAVWPQFGGPTRDFQVPATIPLADRWPGQGPPRLWARPLGQGYSGIVTDGARLFTMFRRGPDEVTVALDPATGETIWEHATPVVPLDDQDLTQGAGPHATPLVSGDAVCTVGVTGTLQCFDAATGRLRWRRELVRDLGGTPVFRGYSSSPLAWGDRVIVPVGGEGRGLVAFDRGDGREVWRAGNFDNTNGSPIRLDAVGRSHVVAFGHRGLAAFDAATGAQLWTHDHPQRFADNISLPVWNGAHLFCTSALDGGARLIAIDEAADGPRPREIWHQPRFGVYFTNVLWLGDHVYGTTGGLGPTFLTALDTRTGDVAWQTRDVPRASLLHADGKVVMLTETGELLLTRLSPDGVTILARTPLLDEGPPTPLTLVGRTLLARDGSRLVALDLGAGPREGPDGSAGF
jgi:outer membrane protein assembly factor BamB